MAPVLYTTTEALNAHRLMHMGQGRKMQTPGGGPPAWLSRAKAILLVVAFCLLCLIVQEVHTSLERSATDHDAKDVVDSPGRTQREVVSGADPMTSCVDVLVPYHDDDRMMLVENGGLLSMQHHLQGIRHFYIVSASNTTFLHLMDEGGGRRRTYWVSESSFPFTKESFVGGHQPRSLGWIYQQAIKYWSVLHMPGLCNNVLVMDADNVWLRPFNVVTKVQQADGSQLTKYKYNLASKQSGAYEADIDRKCYHHAMGCMLAVPKVLATSHTAVNHWMLMQRDVLAALEANVRFRGYTDLVDAMRKCAWDSDGCMSEYEAYFSYIWTFWRQRVDVVQMPYIMRNPKVCNANNSTQMQAYKGKDVYNLVCHDNWSGKALDESLLTSCKQKGVRC